MESLRILGQTFLSYTIRGSSTYASVKCRQQVFFGALGMAAAASLTFALGAKSETAEEIPKKMHEVLDNVLVGKKSISPRGSDIDAEEKCMKPRASDLWKDLKEGSVTEPKTKLKFPLLLCTKDNVEEIDADGCQVLTGIGLRSKSIINLKTIRVYAFGVYVSPKHLREKLGAKYKGVVVTDLSDQQEFFEDLLSHELDMTVRLVVYYKGLKMDMVRNAFDTSLRNRLQKIAGSDKDPGLRTFSEYFSQPMKIPRGTVIDFKWQPGGTLVTTIAGKEMEPIQSRNFCKAFFDMYIGEPPVCAQAKKQIGETFARLLSC